MRPTLLARVCMQALDYGELMLTQEEFREFWHWCNAHPGASCTAGGRLYVFDEMTVHVLCDA